MCKMRHSLLGLLLLLASPAYGWGLKQELVQTPRWLAASLTARAWRQPQIRYCLDLPSAEAVRFPAASLHPQITAALQLWLTPLVAQKGSPVGVAPVPCTDAFDLKIVFGSTAAGDTANGAFTAVLRQDQPAHDAMVVKIDSDYVWHETRNLPGNPNGAYHWQDFAVFARPERGETLASLLADVSAHQPQSLDQFAAARGLGHSAVFWTTYHTFIHEFGHAFGLCDTNEALLAQQCHPQWRSAGAQPSSVMRDSNYFYLTADDRAGLRAVLALVRKAAP